MTSHHQQVYHIPGRDTFIRDVNLFIAAEYLSSCLFMSFLVN